MKTAALRLLPLLVFTALAQPAGAGLLETVTAALASTNSPAATAAGLSADQMTAGLKEALGQGVSNAIVALGHSGGFLTNSAVRIPLPGKLQSVESALKLAGQGRLVEDFVASMNHAAEQAVPVAAGVFGDAIKQMTIADARAILTGTNDAATQYFRRVTQTNLFARFLPIVKTATDSVGVTAQYKAMMAKFDGANSLGSMFGSKSKSSFDATDIDGYVTKRALDGLFLMVAAEEKNIRANPLARTTDLLKQVFSPSPK